MANFLLLSWLNALYSFDYKWSLTSHSLQKRVHFFEHHWAFFAGKCADPSVLLGSEDESASSRYQDSQDEGVSSGGRSPHNMR